MISTNKITASQELQIYIGSDFAGCLVIRDINGNPYLIAEGDEITLLFKPTDKTMTNSFFVVTLTSKNEILGEYPFSLSAQQTATMKGNYHCHAFIRFWDGGYFQILPDTPVKALIPYEMPLYSKDKNRITVQVPRMMGYKNHIPGILVMQELVTLMDDANNQMLMRSRQVTGTDIIMIANHFDTNNITPSAMVEQISTIVLHSEAEAVYVTGFLHADEKTEQEPYREAVRTAFRSGFIDAEAILKTPVMVAYSNELICTRATDALRHIPNAEDVLAILHHEYIACMLEDETHFSEKGSYAAAKVILQEVFRRNANVANNNESES